MREPGHHIGAFRKVGKWLKPTCWSALNATISQFGVDALWKRNLTELSLTYLPNGSYIRCYGLDDPQKIKSIEGLSTVWMEEATDFTRKDYMQMNLRIRGKTPGHKQIILSFNPIDINHWLKKLSDQAGDRIKFVRTTFHDNRFLDEEYIRDVVLPMKEEDEYFWRVYGLGEWGVVGNLVLRRPLIMDAWPDEVPSQQVVYGLDFGYNNPTALVRCDINAPDVWLTEEIYESRLTNQDLIDMMIKQGISKQAPIYADSAEPDRAEELRVAGFNVYAADKAVTAGLTLLNGLRLRSRNENSNLNTEASTYKWKEDADGNPTDDPVKAKDHAIDCCRYALYTHLRDRIEAGDQVTTIDFGSLSGPGELLRPLV